MTRAYFSDHPRVVKASPCLHCLKLSDLRRHYDSYRNDLLAYCAFPNGHPHMGSASAISALDEETASELFEQLVTADAGTRKRWGVESTTAIHCPAIV